MDLTDVAVDLYGLTPGEFTAARNARAKQARADGDRDLASSINALRKPSVAAWAVNLLARERPDQVEQVLALGVALQQAQAALDGATLRELGRRQHELLATVRRDAGALAADAGQRLTEAVDQQVEGTLRAAMADPAAAAAVRSGLLTSELVSTGFEPVDVEGSVAVPGAPSLTGAAGETLPAVGVAATPDTGIDTENSPGERTVLPGRARLPSARDDEATGQRPARRRAAGESGSDAGAGEDSGGRTATKPRRGKAAPGEQRAAAEAETRPGPRGTPDKAAASQDREEARRRQAERDAAERERAVRERRAAAQSDLDEAEQAAADAAEVLGGAEAAVEDVERRHTELEEEIDGIQARLRALRDEQIALTVRERRAHAARDAAARAVDAAARRVRSVRERLEKLD